MAHPLFASWMAIIPEVERLDIVRSIAAVLAMNVETLEAMTTRKKDDAAH